MPRRQPIAHWVVAFVLAISLSACSRTTKPDDYEKDKGLAAGFVVAALSRPPSTGGPAGKIILPDPTVIRCSTSSCPPILPDGKDPRVVYPWQVSLDYNNGSVIGLTAVYDDPTSVGDVRAAVNERYGKFAFGSNGKTPVDMWRVEPEKLAISLSTNEYGMVQLIYLTFGARHPTSEKATKRFLDRMMKDGN